MSDFFEGLAARSSGAATALRPRVASAYERHDGGVEVVEEEVPAATHSGGQAILPVPGDGGQAGLPVLHHHQAAAPARQVVVRDVVLTRTETGEAPPGHEQIREQIEVPVHDERIAERVVHVPGGAQAIPPVQPGRIAWPPPVEVHTGERTEHHHHHRVQEAVSAAEAAAAPTERVLIEERARDTPGEETRQVIRQLAPVNRPPVTVRQPSPPFARPSVIERQSPPAEPVVRITIGRVEVRAVQPPQPAPRPAPAPPPQGPTLEEFLEQRERRQ